jgi:hypothetical protein
MGLNAYIFKSNLGECSNSGVSARYDQVCIVNIEGPFEPDDNHPAVELVADRVEGIARIVPVELVGRWAMMGGCYIATSDSRFSQAVEKLIGNKFYGAVPLHDRVEQNTCCAF